MGQGVPRADRRKFIKLLLALGGAASVAYAMGSFFMPAKKEGGEPTAPPAVTPPTTKPKDRLDEFASNVFPGGPPKDGIPAIDNPRFISASEGDKLLRPDDVVFGLVYNGESRAYPQKILVWHEIVNDKFGDDRISITYCPLTGSAVGFKGRDKDGSPLTFGTTGNLVNSNLLMYDRETDSNWPQILGTAISGPLKGYTLQEKPLVWTSWQRWKARHPKTVVLSTDTGYARPYGRDPYGDYLNPSQAFNYYYDDRIWFPVMAKSQRFHPKKVMIGVKGNGSYLAIPKWDGLWRIGVANAYVGDEPIVAVYDEPLNTARVFSRKMDELVLNFKVSNGKIVDSETGSEWNPEGVAQTGSMEGKQLMQVRWFDVFWFAWYAFFPGTEVLMP